MTDNTLNNTCTIGINQCECFQKLTDEEFQLVEKNSVEVEYAKGEVLCKQGTFASSIMFLSEGLVKVYLQDDKETLILKIISAGNLIGISSSFEGNMIYQYSAAAYVNSKVKLVDINIFRQLLHQNSEFAASVVNILSVNSIQIYGRFFCLINKQSYGRLADILMCLSDRVFKSKSFELDLTRKELAELSGMATESVIRTLKRFKDENLISENGKVIEIIDPVRLKKISTIG